MQDRYAYQTTPPPGGKPGRSAPPSSSRMMASYLSDIELLLEEQRWEQALREAFDLPQIAVALSDLHMQATVDNVQAWCEQWVRHGDEATAAVDSDAHRIVQLVCERADRASLANESAPALALRRLRLHRLQRTRHRGFTAGPLELLGPEAADAAQICTTLVHAARRWYAQSACHDAVVQANLARLAVLR
ncbi:MAG: hypothetical protein KGL45_02985 [Gammaproteobacteria bacterium]|nr:hypothetical protein [Gammaproteobacteria bacterium]MDE2261467.1 hypothetical protein [Gammaproteobacteria bacterium]